MEIYRKALKFISNRQQVEVVVLKRSETQKGYSRMNLFFRWRLFSLILQAVTTRYEPSAANAIGRLKGMNGKAWVDFTTKLRRLKLREDFNLALGLLWFSVNSRAFDRLGYPLKRQTYFVYCAIHNHLFFNPELDSRMQLRIKETFDSALKTLGLPEAYLPSDEDLGFETLKEYGSF